MVNYALTLVLFFFGGIVQGCMGFGMAMVVAPPLLMFLAPTTVVPAMTIASFFNTSTAAWTLRRHMRPGIIAPLFAGSLLGLPLGIYLLKTLDGPVFKAGVGTLMILLAVLLLSGWRRPLRNPRAALIPVGFASGFLGGSISISGPPIVLFLTNLEIPRDEFRANSLGYFAFTGIAALAGFYLSGIITPEIAWYGLGLIPAVFLGTQVGLRLATRLSQAIFQRVTLIAVSVMGLLLLIRSLKTLL